MSQRPPWTAALSWLRQSTITQLFLLFVFVLIIKGHPVPEPVTEYLYLTRMIKEYNPGYIAGDWTLATPAYEHIVFNKAFGWLGLFLSMEVVGWLGRIVSWLLILLALLRIGRRLELPPWLASLAITLWITQEQSVVASEWAIGGFEAKVVSYLFLFFSLDFFLQERRRWGAFLLGLSFSFHPAVGLSAGLAIGFALLFFRLPFRQLAILAGLVVLGALPGLIPTLLLVSQKSMNMAGAWEFVCTVQANQHLDPWSWPLRERIVVYILFAFNLLHFRTFREHQGLRFLFFFQVALALFFALGLWWRSIEAYHLVRYFPFRLFPVFVLLCFFLQLMMVFHFRSQRTMGVLGSLFGVLSLMCMSNPISQFVDDVNQTRILWRAKTDGLTQTLRWVRNNTPKQSMLIMPPWEGRSFHLAQRPQVANWWANRYDKLSEWKERLEALVGKIPPMETEAKQKLLEKRYNNRTPQQIQAIVTKYGGDYLVSQGRYSYPVVFRSPTYLVYDVRGLKPSSGSTPTRRSQ